MAPSASISATFDNVFNSAPEGPKDQLTLEHFTALAELLRVQVDDIIFYILAWKLECQTPLTISRSEWVEGFKKARIDTLDKLIQSLPTLRNEIKGDAAFKQFYLFTFLWAREKSTAKYIALETAVELWKLLLTGKSFVLLNDWLKFIEQYGKSVSKDLWGQTLEFLSKTKDIAGYDSAAAWPSAMDDFVAWKQKS